MKVIGTNEEGDVLLQASRQEFIELERLCQAVEGHTISHSHMYPPGETRNFSPDYDLGTVYSAIRIFYEAKFSVNEMKLLVNNMDQVVMGQWSIEDESSS